MRLNRRYSTGIMRVVAIATIIFFLLTPGTVAWGQLPFVPNRNQNITVPNSSNLIYASVTLHGRKLFDVAATPSAGGDIRTQKTPLQQRIRQIEQHINEILKIGFNPETLQVTMEKVEGDYVITAADPPRLAPQVILTITALDSQLYGESISMLAKQRQEELRKSLIEAYQALQPQAIMMKAGTAVGILVGMILLSLLFANLRKSINTQLNAIGQNDQGQIQEGLTASSEGDVATMIDQAINQKYKRSELRFQKKILWWIQVVVWFGGIVAVLLNFPWTCGLGNWLLNLPTLLLLFVGGTSLAIAVSFITLDRWSKMLIKNPAISLQDSGRLAVRLNSFIPIIKGLLTVVFWVVGSLLILNVLRIPLAPILGGAGIAGFAVSLASQTLIKDTLNGCFILFEDQYAIGDWIGVNNFFGQVENLNLRITTLRTSQGTIIMIPNSEIAIVQNSSKDWSKKNIIISLAYGTDVDQAIAILEELAQEVCEDRNWNTKVIEAKVMGIESVSAGGVNLGVSFQTKPGVHESVIREYYRRVKKRFDREQLKFGT